MSEVYSNVYPTSIQITVLASDVAERWMLCTHEGSCAQFHKGKKVPPLKTRCEHQLLRCKLYLLHESQEKSMIWQHDTVYICKFSSREVAVTL